MRRILSDPINQDCRPFARLNFTESREINPEKRSSLKNWWSGGQVSTKLHGGLPRNSRYRNNPINPEPGSIIDAAANFFIFPRIHTSRGLANFPRTKKLIIRVLTAALGHESISTLAIRVNMGIERRAFKRPRVHLQMNKFIFARK